MLRLPNFSMLFQLVLTKFFKSELFSCLPKVDHVIKSCKGPIIFLKQDRMVESVTLTKNYIGHVQRVNNKTGRL